MAIRYTLVNLISHSTHERQLIELIAAINSKQICWAVHAHIIWPESFSCRSLWESGHAAPLQICQAGAFTRLCFHVDRAINKIYVNGSLIVLQQRFDKAEGEGTCQRSEMCGGPRRRSPQPNIWSPFQAPTVPHNRSHAVYFWNISDVTTPFVSSRQ